MIFTGILTHHNTYITYGRSAPYRGRLQKKLI